MKARMGYRRESPRLHEVVIATLRMYPISAPRRYVARSFLETTQVPPVPCPLGASPHLCESPPTSRWKARRDHRRRPPRSDLASRFKLLEHSMGTPPAPFPPPPPTRRSPSCGEGASPSPQNVVPTVTPPPPPPPPSPSSCPLNEDRKAQAPPRKLPLPALDRQDGHGSFHRRRGRQGEARARRALPAQQATSWRVCATRTADS